LYAGLENISETQKVIDLTLPLAKELELEQQVTRLELIEISISVGKKSSVEIIRKRQALTQKADISDDQKLAAEIYMVVGQSEYANNLTSDALKHLKLAYQLSKQVEAHNITGETLNTLANIYIGLDDPETALDYYKQCLELNKLVKSPLADSIVFFNMGKAYLASQRLDLAKQHFELSLNKSIAIDDELGTAWSQISLAELAVEEQRLKDALKYLEKSTQVIENSGDNRIIFRLNLYKTLSYIGLSQLKNAEMSIKKLKDLADEQQNPSYKISYFFALAKWLEAKGDFQAAFEAQKTYSELLQESFLDKQRNIVQKYRIQFDSELKENRNKVLIKENELKNLRIEQQESEKKYWLLIVILAGLVIIIIIAVLFKQIDIRNQFRKMALRDYLTKSPNRRAILREAEQRFELALRSNQNFSIGIIDFDNFKKLNDSYGHDVGDQVLKIFAKACSSVLRNQDAFGRYGGEEWLIVFSDTQKEYIHSIFERLTLELNKSPIKGVSEKLNFSFSMGVAQLNPAKDSDLRTMISRADANLYKAKENGRNQVVL
jgi:diguanylate cyclase (GGDEF)-like protein